jgi:hypothetical protein
MIARRTTTGVSCALGLLPFFIAFATHKYSLLLIYPVIAAIDIYCLSINQRIRNNFMCLLDNPRSASLIDSHSSTVRQTSSSSIMGIPLGLK